MNYTPSREDYLVSIYMLQKKQEHVRSIDVARMLGFSKPSVFKALRVLMEHELVTMDGQKFVELTEKGEVEAELIYERYEIVQLFLRNVLKVSEETAYQDACKMEHIVSPETLERMRELL